MRVFGLSFFGRVSDGSINIVSYHPSSSITWLWYLNVSKQGSREYRRWWHYYCYSHWQGEWTAGLSLLKLVDFRIQRQRRMNRRVS